MSETTSVTAHDAENLDHGMNGNHEPNLKRDSAMSTNNNSGLLAPDHLPKTELPSEQTSITGNELVVDEKAPVKVEEVSPRDIHGAKWLAVVLGILSSILLFSLDNTIVADIQPAIIEKFGEVKKLPWVSVAFTLAAASTNLLFGKIYAQFNAKWTYIICVGIFELGSALCGAAQSMNMLIIGRAVCGLGGIGLYIGVMTLLSVTTTIQERPMYLGSTGLIWGIGTILGPLIGGVFVSTWRWAFYINLVIGGIFAPIYLWLIPSMDPRPGASMSSRIREIDLVGAILVMGVFVSGVLAISFGGLLFPWDSGTIIACFVVSGVLFIIVGIQQSFSIFTTPERRLLPLQFLRSRTMILLFIAIACAAAILVVPLYLLPLFFQFTRNDTALKAAVRLLPFIILMVFACLANGAILSIYGLYMPWYLVGGVLALIGSALMFTITTTTSTSAVYGYSSLMGLGVGVFIQAGFSIAGALVPLVEIPSAVGFITCGQITGLGLGLSIGNAVFLNKAQNGIQEVLPGVAKEQIQAAIAGVAGQFVHGLEGDLKERVLAAIVKAMDWAYVGVIAAAALVIVVSLLMKRERLFLAPGGAA